MLESISIKNIVLIDDLNVDFDNGLCILTGETGSGKSILLDALMLAIGGRYNLRLLRNGEKQGSVSACFNIKNNQIVDKILDEQGIEHEEILILRRVVFDDGKSKSFVNNTPVSQSFLQLIGKELIEIHGQHDQTNLLNSSFHRDILDDFGNLHEQKIIVSKLYNELKETNSRYNCLLSEKEDLEKEKDYLSNVIKELEELDFHSGEEEVLSDKRISLMNKEKIIDLLNTVNSVISGQNPVIKSISSAQNYLSKNSNLGESLIEKNKNAFEEIIDSFEKSIIEFNEGVDKIEIILQNLEYDEDTLDEIEERLFKIRNISRKYNIQIEFINDFLEEVKIKLEKLEKQTVECEELREKLKKTEKEYLKEALILREKRKETAKNLSEQIINELIPLKMNKVVFDVQFTELELKDATNYGLDSVKFVASTNVGTKLDELSKIASGGELSRFMLALKVVLSKIKSVPTLIFDEIDTGVSGAVANAIGERLEKLGKNLQVFIITHLPQVASKGNFHLKISKEFLEDKTRTIVEKLDESNRKIEIAKMISGENVSDEAIKTAEKLLIS